MKTVRIRHAVRWVVAGAAWLTTALGLWCLAPEAADGRSTYGLERSTSRELGQGQARAQAQRAQREQALARSNPQPGTRLLEVRDKAYQVEPPGKPADVLLPDPSGKEITLLDWERRTLAPPVIEYVARKTSTTEETVQQPVKDYVYIPDQTLVLPDLRLYKAGFWDIAWGSVESDERLPDSVQLRGTATQEDALNEKKKYRMKDLSSFTITGVSFTIQGSHGFLAKAEVETPYVSWRFSENPEFADVQVRKALPGYTLLHLDKGLIDPGNVHIAERASRDEQPAGCEAISSAPVVRVAEASFPDAKSQPAQQRTRPLKRIRTAQLVDFHPYSTQQVSVTRRSIEPVTEKIVRKTVEYEGGIQRLVVNAWDTVECHGIRIHRTGAAGGDEGDRCIGWWGNEHHVESWIEDVPRTEKVTETVIYDTIDLQQREVAVEQRKFELKKQEYRFQNVYAEYDKLTPITFHEQPGADGRVPGSWGSPGGLTYVLPDGSRHQTDSPKAWAYASRNAIPKPCEGASELPATAGRPVAGPGAGAGSGTGATGPGSGTGAAGPSDPGRKGGAQASGPEAGGQMANRRILAVVDAPADFQIGDPVLSGDVSAGSSARHASVAAQRRLLGAQHTRSEGARGQG